MATLLNMAVVLSEYSAIYRPIVTCGIRLPNQFEVLRASGFTFVIRT